MLDRIGGILKERYPEHLGGYLNGWLYVFSVEEEEKKTTLVASSGQEIFTMIEFESDRKQVIQLFENGKIVETKILY